MLGVRHHLVRGGYVPKRLHGHGKRAVCPLQYETRKLELRIDWQAVQRERLRLEL